MRIRLILVYAVVCCCLISAVHAVDVASLKSKAASGDVKAQVGLAQAYEKGESVPQNDDLAAKWFRAAAEKGDPQAQNELGILYRRGAGVPQDKAQAVEWYARSAAQGYGPGRFNLAVCYYNGDGVGVDDSLAYAWFRLAAAAGSKEAAEAVGRMENELAPVRLDGAKLTLANMLMSGQQVQKDLAGAFALRSEVAGHGDRDAQYSVGRMYAEGIGTPQNSTLALKILNECGSVEATNYMADMYLQGQAVSRDPKKAADLLEKTALFSNQARLKLAGMYWDGDAIPQDYKKALKHYGFPTLAGDPIALYRSGLAYRDGLGVKKNAATACMYFVVAANMGSSEALKVVQPECPGEKLEAAKKKAVEYIRAHRLITRPLSTQGH